MSARADDGATSIGGTTLDGGTTGSPMTSSTSTGAMPQGSETTVGLGTGPGSSTTGVEYTSTGVTGTSTGLTDTDSTGPGLLTESGSGGSSSTGWPGCEDPTATSGTTGGPMCLGDDCFSDGDCCACLICDAVDDDAKGRTCIPGVETCGISVDPCDDDGDCCDGLSCQGGYCADWAFCGVPMQACLPGSCCPGLTCDSATGTCSPLGESECTDVIGSASFGASGVGTCEDGVQAEGEFCYRAELLDFTAFGRDLTLADFDGDTNLDIAVVGGSVVTWSCRERLTILLGDGNGGFAELSTSPMPAWTDRVIAADMTGDGTADLVIGNYARIRVWEGVGDGTFSPGAALPGQLLDVADMNADGELDIVGAVGTGSIRLMTNDGSGAFTVHEPENAAAGGQWRIVSTADWDYDGNADVFSGGGALLGGDGNGTLQYVDDYEVGQMLGASLEDAITVDFEGTGEPALVTVGTGAILNILPTTDPAGPGGLVEHDLPGQSLAVAAGQLDGAGIVDLVVTQRLNAALSIYSGTSIDDLSEAVEFEVGTGLFGARPRDVEIGDVNGDGYPDIVTAQYNEGSITVLIATP